MENIVFLLRLQYPDDKSLPVRSSMVPSKQQVRNYFTTIPLGRLVPSSLSSSRAKFLKQNEVVTDVMYGSMFVKVIFLQDRLFYMIETNSDPDIVIRPENQQQASACYPNAASWTLPDVKEATGLKILSVHKADFRRKSTEWFHLKYGGIEQIRGFNKDQSEVWAGKVLNDILKLMKKDKENKEKTENLNTYVDNFLKWMKLVYDGDRRRRIHSVYNYVKEEKDLFLKMLDYAIDTEKETYRENTILLILQFIVFCASARYLIDLLTASREGDRFLISAGFLDILNMESILLKMGGKTIFQSGVDFSGCTNISLLVDSHFFKFSSPIVDNLQRRRRQYVDSSPPAF